MNLQTHVSDALWSAIESAYQAQNYSHAILEATYYLSALIRDRAGVDGDGASLVGQALGGEAPRLKLNALQTESEKNVQKGYEQILRGIYLGIRNPRSHEQATDTKETADAIIHFLGHVIQLLSASKETFTIDSFVERVFDSEFVESQRYAELIIAEIPKLRLADAAIALFRSRRRGELRKLRFLILSLVSALSTTQLDIYLGVVGDEFRTTKDDGVIRTSLQLLTPEVWPKLPELPRLRVENKLISGIRVGEVLDTGKTTQPLSTWANDFLKAFTLKTDAASALMYRLESIDPAARHYVAKFFMRNLPEVVSTPNQTTRCINAIVAAVRLEDENVKSGLITWVRSYPTEWQTKLAEALKDKTEPDNAAVYFDDGTPFLASPAKDEFDDDIPF